MIDAGREGRINSLGIYLREKDARKLLCGRRFDPATGGSHGCLRVRLLVWGISILREALFRVTCRRTGQGTFGGRAREVGISPISYQY